MLSCGNGSVFPDFLVLERIVSALSGADLNDVLHVVEKDFSVSDIACIKRILNGLD